MKLILVLLFLVSCCPSSKDYKKPTNVADDYYPQQPSPENGNGTGVPFQN